ncbi:MULTISPECIES: alpha/beta fold hydrolase [Sphingomonas]|uniref:Alpha/beta fold hydrolase n=1 Tax=Sphingomonas carotinifaciens TaxID=1166323 RepID=A0A1G7IDD1_9SPHN|nr:MULTISPECIES: alpha/beta fold hydrolase [Sphingomonas]MBB4084926.1 pimeloyl-ACP methyl ester carboxylesterase [Sphingomonas carotinifaciens]MWC44309.1 alpha/beta fold hydrolase [Sphingomonas carotinifaciens]SDF10359.1 Pimeloyl-ACP methyl ester carboxylesterase [Sphingomonas carotinifaciens]
MADFPIETHYFDSFDGTRLAWHEMGAGRPIVLIHGYFSDANTNWIRYGHAAAIAAKGYRVIMPDLRAHGQSARPHDDAAYFPDVLTRDGHALIEHLDLGDYDLGGYSLGARTTSRMVATGAEPGRIIFAGMGLDGLTDTNRRVDHFTHILTNLGQHKRGSPEWLAEAFLKTTGGDPVALLGILRTFADTPLETIRGFAQPTLVVAGVDDFDNGSAKDLADTLPNATYTEIPGGHMSCVAKPELGQAIAAFL